MVRTIRRLAKRWGGLAVCAVALANSGCLLLAGGAAAGGAAGYAYYRGNVRETYASDFTTAWHGAHDALYDLGMPIKEESRDAWSGTIETVCANGDKVKIYLEQELPKIPTDGPKTEIGVRVATFGDEAVSRRILQQIAYRIGPLPGNADVNTAARPVNGWQPPPR